MARLAPRTSRIPKLSRFGWLMGLYAENHVRLVRLFDEKLKSDFSHYLVFPPRARSHQGLQQFSAWVLDEAVAYTSAQT